MRVYDFDGTIYDGDSTLDFWLYCVFRHPKTLMALFGGVFGRGLCFLGLITKKEFKQRFYQFLRYVPNIDLEVNRFWKRYEKKIKFWYLDQKSSADLIISASPEFLLKPICSKLEVQLIASLVDKNNGTCISENCYGHEKVKRFGEVYPGVEIEEFYSDSISDKPMADIAVKAFYVKGEKVVSWNVCKRK